MAITNYVFMARVDMLTLGYHAKSGLASKTDISVIVFGANVIFLANSPPLMNFLQMVCVFMRPMGRGALCVEMLCV
jgi:hypothetical protein